MSTIGQTAMQTQPCHSLTPTPHTHTHARTRTVSCHDADGCDVGAVVQRLRRCPAGRQQLQAAAVGHARDEADGRRGGHVVLHQQLVLQGIIIISDVKRQTK